MNRVPLSAALRRLRVISSSCNAGVRFQSSLMPDDNQALSHRRSTLTVTFAWSQDVNATITGTAAIGDYSGVSFVVGVPEELNHIDPMTLAASDPLTAAGMHWSWLAGFRFARVEMVQLADPGETFGVGLFHPGSTQCSGSASEGTVTCSKPNRNRVTLEGFDAAKDSIVIDVAELFSQHDLTQSQECHATEQVCESMLAAFGVDYATGEANDRQTLFSVD